MSRFHNMKPAVLAAGLALACTAAFGQSYYTAQTSLGKITVNTAYGSQGATGLLVLPTYGMELTDSLSFGFPPNPDVNTATASSQGDTLVITTTSSTDGQAGLQASRAMVPIRSFMVETHASAYLDMPMLIEMSDPGSTAFTVRLAGKLLTSNADIQPFTLSLQVNNGQGATLDIPLHRLVGPLDGSFSFTGTVDAGFGLTHLSYSLDVPSGTLATVQLTSLSLTPYKAAVPEPGTWALMGLGLAGLARVGRRRANA